MQTTTCAPQRKKPKKLQQVEAALVQILADTSRSGFFGTARIVLHVNDGHIQLIKVSVERVVR